MPYSSTYGASPADYNGAYSRRPLYLRGMFQPIDVEIRNNDFDSSHIFSSPVIRMNHQRKKQWQVN